VSDVLRLRARGHPAIRSTHAKTVELTPESTLGVGGSCIIGVGAELLSVPAVPLAGPVEIRLSGGATTQSIFALANPGWSVGGPAVIRRSQNRYPDTLATEADAGAADLPRELVEALRDPSARVELTVRRAARRSDGRGQLVLLFGACPSERLAAESAAADEVISVDAPDDRRAPDVRAAALAARVAEVLAGNGRLLVRLPASLPATSTAAALAGWLDERTAVEVVGLSPELAVAAATAATRAGGPVLVVPSGDRRLIRAQVRLAPAAARLVVRAEPDRLRELASSTGRDRVTWPAGGGPQGGEVMRYGSVAAVPGGADVVACLHPVVGAPGGEVEELVVAMLRHGASRRTAALALAELPGWSRRAAYDLVNRSVVGTGPDAGQDRGGADDGPADGEHVEVPTSGAEPA
jgi:hypothetical protein